MLFIPSGHTFSRVCVICVCEVERPNMSAVMIFPAPYLPHSFSPPRLLFSPCLPHSHSVRWSANYYANDETDIRCVSLFSYFTHAAPSTRSWPHVCVCGEKQGTEAAVDGCRDSVPIYRMECSELNLYVGRKLPRQTFWLMKNHISLKELDINLGL